MDLAFTASGSVYEGLGNGSNNVSADLSHERKSEREEGKHSYGSTSMTNAKKK